MTKFNKYKHNMVIIYFSESRSNDWCWIELASFVFKLYFMPSAKQKATYQFSEVYSISTARLDSNWFTALPTDVHSTNLRYSS